MLVIKHLDGKTFDLEMLNIRVKDFLVTSPEVLSDDYELEGYNGSVNLDTRYGPRTMRGMFRFDSSIIAEFTKRRDLVFRIFGGLQNFYIIDKYEPSKRWLVKTDGWFDVNRANYFGDFEVGFISNSPFSETVNVVKRKYDESEFSFHNQGDVTINMRQQNETVITFKGESNGLTIKNLTTNDEWQYNGSTTINDEIKLMGVRSLKNGQSVFGDTNHKMINLDTGLNKFKISGTSGDFELNIATRFYFL